MSGRSNVSKKDSWLEKTVVDVATPHSLRSTKENQDGSYTQSALIGDYKVDEVTVTYPVYYIVRYKLDKDAEPVAMICVDSVEQDVGYPTSVAVFLRKNFKISKISKEEAETYNVIEVATLYTPVEFAKWISTINEDLGRSFNEAGIMSNDGKLQKGKHTYDLSTRISEKDLES